MLSTPFGECADEQQATAVQDELFVFVQRRRELRNVLRGHRHHNTVYRQVENSDKVALADADNQ